MLVGVGVLATPTQSLAATTVADAGIYTCIHNPQTKNDANWDPNSQCTAKFATIPKGTPTTMICWQDGRVPSGQTSPRWFYVKAKNTGGTTSVGFVHSSRVADQATVGHCSMRREMATTMWATAHLGQVITQDAAERAAFNDWAPGPVGEWSGDCVKLANLAWFGRTYRGNAADLYSQYRRAGVLKPMSQTPVRGALVLWDGATAHGFGHVALSLGNGLMVTTEGLDGEHKPIVIKAISKVPGPDGWVDPAAIVVSGHNPVGHLDSVRALGSGNLRVRGWSWDASDSGVQLATRVYVGGTSGQSGAVGYSIGAANSSRSDVHRVYHSGAYHGIDRTFKTAKRGSQKVCVYAINTGPGSNTLLGCKTVGIT
jgi:hypothetical protein